MGPVPPVSGRAPSPPQRWVPPPPLKVIAPALAPLSSASSLFLPTGPSLSAHGHAGMPLIVKIEVSLDTAIFSRNRLGRLRSKTWASLMTLSHTHPAFNQSANSFDSAVKMYPEPNAASPPPPLPSWSKPPKWFLRFHPCPPPSHILHTARMLF